MKLQIASKQQEKIRLAIMGKAGSGKTYSSLLLAHGLCGDWRKVAIIDTDEKSASLYSHLGPFNTIQIHPPYHPSIFRDALDLAQDSRKEVIIIDSLSLEWIGEGGVRDWMNDPSWKDVIHEHRHLLAAITSAECHVVCTIRTRQRLARFNTSGRGFWNVVELPLQQEGIEYPFTTVLRLNHEHAAHVIKDRTDVFNGTHPSPLTSMHGSMLTQWCNKAGGIMPKELQDKINACNTYSELQKLLFEEDVQDIAVFEAFNRRLFEIDSASTMNAFSNDDQPRPAA